MSINGFIDNNKRAPQRADFYMPMDHFSMLEQIETMCEKYPFLSVTSLGASILGKSLPMLSVGDGEKNIMYVGAHRGNEWEIAAVLMEFIEELCALYRVGGEIFGLDIKTLLSLRSISVVPMLDPDGIEYNLKGISEDNPLYERVRSMNGGRSELSEWKSNARGVDLDKNYICESLVSKSSTEDNSFTPMSEGRMGEWSESEPETGAVCNYLRYNMNVKAIAALYLSENEFYHIGGENVLGAKIADRIGKLLDMPRASEPLGSDLKLGLSQWSAHNIDAPVISIVSASRIRDKLRDSAYYRYIRMKRLLFELPVTV